MIELLSYARERLPDWLELTRLDKPVGIGLLLWPTLWALWLAAEGLPPPDLLAIFLLGVLLTRSAGCVVNDYADRNFDGHVERTRARPIPDGRVKPHEALSIAAVLMGLAFFLVLLTDRLTIMLAFIAAGLAVLYPFTKRMTHMPQLFLGMAFSMAIPMAFSAVTGRVPNVAWLLFVGNLLWTVAYDTEYAMVDRPWDRKVGIKSTAILFGEQDRLMIGILQLAFVACLTMVGTRLELGAAWYAGVVGAAGVLGWQQWLIRDRDLDACFKAFRANNLVGLIVFVGAAADYAFAALSAPS